MNPLILIFKLSPIVLLCALVMSGFDTLVSAPLAFCYAVIVCWLTARKEKKSVTQIIDKAIGSAKDAMIVFFIFMLAYGVAAFFMSTGVGAAVILAAMKLGVTGRSVAVVAFLVSCLLSVGTGTSWGTFAATIPIFIWLGHIVGGDPVLVMCACAGGAAFGDNVALISDTTVMTCGIQGVEIIDRFNKQLIWSLSCVTLASVCFYVASVIEKLPAGAVDVNGAIGEIPKDAWAVLEEERPAAVELLNQVSDGNIPLIMMLPIAIVIGLAVLRLPTIVCLAMGILSSTLMGLCIGTITSFKEFMGVMYDSFADAGSWVIIMVMWIIAFGGVMREMGAFEPLAKLCIKASKKVRHLMFWNSILCIIGNMLLSDDQAQMATMGPVIKDIVDESVEGSEEALYDLRCRNAMYGDAIGVLAGELIPWHVCNIYYVGLTAALYPLMEFGAGDLIKCNFFAWISIVTLLLLTLTGWDRFIPKFGLPSEPEVQLKKNIKRETVDEPAEIELKLEESPKEEVSEEENSGIK